MVAWWWVYIGYLVGVALTAGAFRLFRRWIEEK